MILGSPHPDYWGGLTNTLTWRNFDLRAFVQFAGGHEIYNAIAIFADDGGYYYDNKFAPDLVRRGRALVELGITDRPAQRLFPIPLNEIDVTNPPLLQNPGY